jgi:GTP cyclohydrolase-4
MARQLPDVQATRPDVTVGLSRVGVTDVEKLVEVPREGDRPLVFTADFEVYVDLPGERKGIDMSRNMQVIDETLETVLADPEYRLEDVCGTAADRLLEKHDYTTTAQVRMEADLILRERAPASDLPTQHSVGVVAEATATDDGTHESIGVEVTGMTVCPCSQGMSETRAREVLTDLGVDDETTETFLDRVPQPGHSQRGHAFLAVGADGSPSVDLHDLVRVARDSMSARIYNVAKRPDEDHMTFESHSNARFVEDCVRALAHGVVEEFPDLTDDAVVRMRQSNDESIHQHNAHAERELTMGQLRAETNGDARMPNGDADRAASNGAARNGERD